MCTMSMVSCTIDINELNWIEMNWLKGTSLISKIATQMNLNKWIWGTRSYINLLNLICLNDRMSAVAIYINCKYTCFTYSLKLSSESVELMSTVFEFNWMTEFY